MVQDEYVWDDTYYYGLIVPEGCANPVTLDWEEIEKDEFDGDAEFVSRTRYEQRMKKNFWNDAMQTFGELAGMDTKLLVLLAFNMILTLGVLAVVVKYLVVP